MINNSVDIKPVRMINIRSSEKNDKRKMNKIIIQGIGNRSVFSGLKKISL